MAKNFKELEAKMSPDSRARSDEIYRRLLKEMPLQTLRAARQLTQENLANVLHVKQSEISKIERRTDMYVSTLASYIKAMGGRLEVVAAFPSGEVVRINQFEELAEEKSAQSRVRKPGRK
ncbi:MAG TPA: XRE family transcriptional regulator [Bryobacteraceae bacterium]|nr:XRE family transcriptional regulator [Bryobacteraceae bacterium]